LKTQGINYCTLGGRPAVENAAEAFKRKVQVLSAAETTTDLASSESGSDKSWEVCADGKRAKVEKKGKRGAKLEELAKKSEKKPPRRESSRSWQKRGRGLRGGLRAGRGTLHQLGPDACWMARKKSFAKAEVYEECPDPQYYCTWCKLCWRKEAEKAPESTSDSIDDLDMSDVIDG
jgi:hypothetical protein